MLHCIYPLILFIFNSAATASTFYISHNFLPPLKNRLNQWPVTSSARIVTNQKTDTKVKLAGTSIIPPREDSCPDFSNPPQQAVRRAAPLPLLLSHAPLSVTHSLLPCTGKKERISLVLSISTFPRRAGKRRLINGIAVRGNPTI